MSFQVGQRVSFLNEKGEGIVLEINAFKVLVRDEHGFEKWYASNNIVKIHSTNYPTQNLTIKQADLKPTKKDLFSHTTQSKQVNKLVWEIDLHIEELLESTHGMTNGEILMKQMTEFRAVFSRAKVKSIHKLIVIHGVGEGVLKNEIRTFLARQEQIDVYDADYKEYGKGATAVEFHPNW